MAIHTIQQALAQQLIDELGDKKKGAFGMYLGLIKKYKEGVIRSVLSEVKYDYMTGKIGNKVKIFMYRLKVKNKNNQNKGRK